MSEDSGAPDEEISVSATPYSISGARRRWR